MKSGLRRCFYSMASWYVSLKNGTMPSPEKCRQARKGSGTGRFRLANEGGFGMNELLGIAAALIIAAFVIIPSLRTFAKEIMDGLADWWDDSISSKIFQTT